MGRWRGYLSGAQCRLAYGPADATATHCLLLQEHPDWFYLSGTGSTRVVPDKGPLNGCVCVCVCYLTRSSATADRSHDVMCQSKSCQLLQQNKSVETTGTSSPEQREVMEWVNQQQQQPFNGRLSGTTRVGRYQKKHSGQRTSFITFLHLQWSTASSLFSLRAWQSSRTTSPGPLWFSPWSWTLNFILHAFLHSIIVIFLQHMPIPTQPVWI